MLITVLQTPVYTYRLASAEKVARAENLACPQGELFRLSIFVTGPWRNEEFHGFGGRGSHKNVEKALLLLLFVKRKNAFATKVLF